MTNDSEISAGQALQAALFDDMLESNEYWNAKPLLAHYTTIPTLEAILRGGQIWMSNPLFMSDFEEVRFGYREGRRAFDRNEAIRNACKTEERWHELKRCFDAYWDHFDQNMIIDTFVFCLSEHRPDDNDGLLSMWRGYGGDGHGAAIVFDTAKMTPEPSYPIVLAKVEYQKPDQRIKWLDEKCDRFALALQAVELNDASIYIAAHHLFQRLMFAAIYTKHVGFSEEREWRLTYLKDRDEKNYFSGLIHYSLKEQRIEPKLKLQVNEMPDTAFKMTDVIDRIIMGPSMRSELTMAAFLRMLDHIGMPEIKSRVRASYIPYRQT